MYQYTDRKESIEILRKAGWNYIQIDKIVRFRRNFTLGEVDKAPNERRRLEFARWLFLRGRLNDMGE
jgi:hypothetical protein